MEVTAHDSAAGARRAIRDGEWAGPTAGLAPGATQANLAILPQADAYDFLLFCVRNPKPCPLLDVTEAGSPTPRGAAPDADLRTDLPRYRVWRDGQLVDERAEIADLWSGDLVAFLLGCSFTFESILVEQGLPVRHIEEARNCPVYRTSIACRPAGRFSGQMAVSMRPMTPAQGIRATQISSRFPSVHGAPVHLGDPAAIGIEDITRPDFGDPVTIGEDEIPVFWACGVTPQLIAMQAKPPLMITHAPGHMFITDLRETDHAIL